jgi:hypothetical protein
VVIEIEMEQVLPMDVIDASVRPQQSVWLRGYPWNTGKTAIQG